jgi:hypothetical protein
VRIKVRRELPSLFLPSTTTKRWKQSNPPSLTTHQAQSHPSTQRVRKEIPNPREEGFVCMFCDRAGYLDEFCFRHKRIETMRFGYARNSCRDEFSNFLPHSYSCALPRTSSRALSHFSHEPNHRSYDFGSRENNFVPRRFGYDPRPHRGDRFPCRPSFPAGGSRIHPELRHLDGPRFPCHGSRPTGPNGEV